MGNIGGDDANRSRRNRDDLRFVECLFKADMNGARQDRANPFVWMGVRSDSSAARELHAKNVRTLLLPVP